jgi:hypothetical protein
MLLPRTIMPALLVLVLVLGLGLGLAVVLQRLPQPLL